MDSMSDMSYSFANYSGEYDDPYLKSPLKQILIVSFTLTFLLGLAGNLLVIFVIAKNRSMHTVTNFFLANLAVADLLVSGLCVLPKLLYFVSAGWHYGDFLCKLHNYAMSATTTSSIFILTVISMERFVAILRPLETRRLLTARRLAAAMAAVWLASATFNVHTVWYHEVSVTEGVPYCSASALMFEMDSKASKVQTVVFFLVYYVIPLLVMLVLYGFICQKLWVSSKMRLVAGSADKKEPPAHQQGRSRRLRCLAFLRRLRDLFVRPGNGAASGSAGDGRKPAKGVPGGSAAVAAAAAAGGGGGGCPARTGNPEEVQVLLETQMSDESAVSEMGGAGTEQKIGPFYLDEPDEDSGGGGGAGWQAADNPIIYRPHGKADQEVSLPIGAGAGAGAGSAVAGGGSNSHSPMRPDTGRRHQETPPVPAKVAGHNNNNVCSTVGGRASPRPNQAGRPAAGSRAGGQQLPRPLTISKPERSSKVAKKSKKKEAIAARKKVIKLLIVIVSSFALCLLPYQVLALWITFDEAFPHHAPVVQVFIPFSYLCYFANSALNPFLYAFLSDNFRKRMRETLTLRSSARRQNWMRTQARLRSMTDGNTETETMYTCT